MAIPYLPPDEGLLPKWLFFVSTKRPSLRSQGRAQNPQRPLESFTTTATLQKSHALTIPRLGRRDLPCQQHPILRHPALHPANLQPHDRDPRPRPHLRHLDPADGPRARLRRLPHHRAGVVSIGYGDVRGRRRAFLQRVALLSNGEVGVAAGGAGDYQCREFGVDG